MDWCVIQNKVHFITGLTGNKVLNAKMKAIIKSCERDFERYGKPVKRYHSFSYQAQSWQNPQRVIAKVEVSAKGTNLRFIVTDLWEYRTRSLYEQGYCARGTAELYIKDHKTYLNSGRHVLSSFFGQSIPLVPALGCIRAHARLAGKHVKRKRISRGHDENAQRTVHQDCRAGQGDENESKGRVSCDLSLFSNHRKLFPGYRAVTALKKSEPLL